MKAIFFGTPLFAAQVLNNLPKAISLAMIVTQPDRPRGRQQKISESPVKKTAQENFPSVLIMQPENAKDPAFISLVEKEAADCFIVVAYGQILSKELLAKTPFPINIHASLLPKYRGAAPMQRALMQGEKETGITTMKMNEKMDEGDILLQESISIGQDMTLGELEEALSPLASSVLAKTLENIPKGEPQIHEEATYAPKLHPKEFPIDWKLPAEKIHNQIRALSPKPGAWCFFSFPDKKRCKILRSKISEKKASPGQVIVEKNALIIGTGSQGIVIKALQPEGKNPMDASTFLRGLKTPLQVPLG